MRQQQPSAYGDFGLAVSKGAVPRHSAFIVRGYNGDVDTGAEEDISSFGNITYLSSAETLNIASTDVNDTSAGTGLRSLLISGVDGNNDPVSEVVPLNGTSNVLTTNSYLRVNQMVGVSAGSSAKNVGTITATASSAGTIQHQMDAGEGMSRCGIYRVPNGYSAYAWRAEFNAVKITGAGGGGRLSFSST